jgi:hypothetical protein
MQGFIELVELNSANMHWSKKMIRGENGSPAQYPWSNQFAIPLICKKSATKDELTIFIAIYLLM